MQIKGKSLEWLQNGEKMLKARLKFCNGREPTDEEMEMYELLGEIEKELNQLTAK
jgi:hypothetical protein